MDEIDSCFENVRGAFRFPEKLDIIRAKCRILTRCIIVDTPLQAQYLESCKRKLTENYRIRSTEIEFESVLARFSASSLVPPRTRLWNSFPLALEAAGEGDWIYLKQDVVEPVVIKKSIHILGQSQYIKSRDSITPFSCFHAPILIAAPNLSVSVINTELVSSISIAFDALPETISVYCSRLIFREPMHFCGAKKVSIRKCVVPPSATKSINEII